MLRRIAFACALMLLPCVAEAAPPKLNEILITLDPTTDFESTLPGWATKNFSALGCETQPKLANQPPLKSPPFTLAEVIDLAKKAKRLRQTTKQRASLERDLAGRIAPHRCMTSRTRAAIAPGTTNSRPRVRTRS